MTKDNPDIELAEVGEFRSIKIKYKKQKPADITFTLGDIVTVRVGDWYFKGEVKLVRNEQ